ncbi:hypothetical protein F5883DRAFT_409148 [Diaporthe sp. PMI_573]|nr:hypothetical protein F5883DRAFT_409148 [Diaporthaceae sp. PMI_573]
MTSQPRNTATAKAKVDEGLVACSPNEWAQMVLQSQSIPNKDPQKNNKIWDFGMREHVFSSGSDLTKEDYLRLRVLWYTWTDIGSFRSYMRDNPALLNDEQQNTPYTGYISPENDEIANAIYNAIKPKLDGYLYDIRRVGKGDATRPSADCGMFYMTRYWQGLVSIILKEVYDENDKKRHFRGKVRKSEAGLPQAPGPSRPPQTPTKQKQPRQPQEGFGTPALDEARASAGGLQNPATADETYVNTALLLLLQTGDSPDPLAIALSQARGLRYLDWLADRLPLSLVDRSSKATSAKKLMEARVDGYLCRRDFVQDSNNDKGFHPRFNKYPLAILEAKPFTRLSALSAIRWQESAEIASWVSGLDDAYEGVGLLQSSTSGRKRRLLISQDRHELWIIIAEYGDKWKHYIRGNKTKRPTDFDQSQDVKDLAGSEGFVSLAKEINPERFQQMMQNANNAKKGEGSTRTSRGPSIELPGSEYFCIMQQWGPYKSGDAAHMDFFIRRLIGLQVQLLKNWPLNRFQHPYPR